MLPEPSQADGDLTRAVGSLLQADPARVLLLVANLRGPGRSIESTVRGMSMHGCLAPGDHIRIEIEQQRQYASGTVIAFLVGDALVVHRVVHRGRAGTAAGLVLTCGDAPIVPDQPVSQDQILGRVSGVFQNGGWIGPGEISRRSLRARMLRAVIQWSTTALLYLSPGLTAMLLSGLHRWEGAVRQARSRRALRRVAFPRRTH